MKRGSEPRRRMIRSLLIVGILLAPVMPTLAVAAGAATAVIERFNGTLLKVMQDADTLRFRGRYQLLEPAVKSSFDLAFMARFSVGRYWKKLSPDQQAKLVNAFSRLTIATYADRFNDYSGESFRILGEKKVRENIVLVRTEIVKADGDRVAINYLMHQGKNAKWKVIDIFLKGRFSELAKRRSEYSSVFKRQGFEGLIAAVEEKVRRIEASGS